MSLIDLKIFLPKKPDFEPTSTRHRDKGYDEFQNEILDYMEVGEQESRWFEKQHVNARLLWIINAAAIFFLIFIFYTFFGARLALWEKEAVHAPAVPIRPNDKP